MELFVTFLDVHSQVLQRLHFGGKLSVFLLIPKLPNSKFGGILES